MEDNSLPPEVVAIMNNTGAPLLAAWRLYRGLSINDVAARLRVMPRSLERWEEANNPCHSVLYSMAKLYDCRVAELID